MVLFLPVQSSYITEIKPMSSTEITSVQDVSQSQYYKTYLASLAIVLDVDVIYILQGQYLPIFGKILTIGALYITSYSVVTFFQMHLQEYNSSPILYHISNRNDSMCGHIEPLYIPNLELSTAPLVDSIVRFFCVQEI